MLCRERKKESVRFENPLVSSVEAETSCPYSDAIVHSNRGLPESVLHQQPSNPENHDFGLTLNIHTIMLAIHAEHDVGVLLNWLIAQVRIVALAIQCPLVLLIGLHARVVLGGNTLLSHRCDAAAAHVGGLGPVLGRVSPHSSNSPPESRHRRSQLPSSSCGNGNRKWENGRRVPTSSWKRIN